MSPERWTPEQVAVLRTLWEILLPVQFESGRRDALRLLEAEIFPQAAVQAESVMIERRDAC